MWCNNNKYNNSSIVQYTVLCTVVDVQYASEERLDFGTINILTQVDSIA